MRLPTREMWISMAMGALVAYWLLQPGQPQPARPAVRISYASSPSANPLAAAPPSAEPSPERLPVPKEAQSILDGARSTLKDQYDAGYYAGGPPPRGRGACTDVIYWAYLKAGVNLQDKVDADIKKARSGYPNIRDRNIDYRYAPNLIVWFRRHVQSLPIDKDWRPGDVVFWSLMNDGVADHCGIISDVTVAGGRPFVIHNFPPASREDDVLEQWKVVGHFRGLPH